jgi:redox-sensitive bicupin YhaK (pirin superfamily)
MEGAGVYLRRAFGFDSPQAHDPFLLFDDFRSDTPEQYRKGFPWHPHRGIETITYVLKGDVEHGDSLGNKGVISSGDVQWMTAGSGIIHQEMPKGDADGAMHGFQLWLNLPAAEKMCRPRYRDIRSDAIPRITLAGGAECRIICGEINGVAGPVQGISTEPQYFDITLPPDTDFMYPTRFSDRAIAYVIAGSGGFSPGGSTVCVNRTVLLYSDGDEIQIRAGKEGLRFLLFLGKPLGESIAWQGPIVMNTREELELAFLEYRQGTFLKHKKPAV